ncbi:unnamed protein product [Prorocentrum cordatum]|uniref:Ion transport domain-containing protein n=1 Tax=Prorocentrum cordatum TaxID=2364126 RepID=A0ABN9SVR4_9DINO|nr:unnamed protein product [Polarella glacialis]
MLENLATAAFLFAVVNSMRDSFAAVVPRVGKVSSDCESVYENKILSFADRLDDVKNGVVRDDSRLISPVQFITHCLEDEVDRFSALYYEILFDDNRTHGLALFLFLCRLLDICMAFRGTAWIGFTVALAARKLMYFLVLYVLVICCFGAIMEVSFGNNFLQFRSLPQACLALILFTFGQSENAFRGVYPMEEYHGFWVSIYMLVFAIMVITVAMQFFVSIVLDAYNIVQDEQLYLEKDHEEFLKLYTSIATLFFPKAMRDGRDYRRELRKRSFYHLSQLLGKARVRAETWSHPRHRGDLELQELPDPTHAASAPAVEASASARHRPRPADGGRSPGGRGPEPQPLALRVSEVGARFG